MNIAEDYRRAKALMGLHAQKIAAIRALAG